MILSIMVSAMVGSAKRSYYLEWETWADRIVEARLYLDSAISKISLLSSSEYDLRPISSRIRRSPFRRPFINFK